MKHHFNPMLPYVLLGVFLLAHFGCTSSPPTRLYLLSSLSTPETRSLSGESCFSIGIGPMNMPAYLDGPNIVTRTTVNEIFLAEFDQWAEPLKDNAVRVFSQNLSTLLCTKTIVVFPWGGKIPIDYRIEIDVLRFDGNLGGNVSLEAWWRLFSGDGKRILLAKKSNVTEAVGGQDYKSLVAAQGRALGHLSRDIAEAIKILPR